MGAALHRCSYSAAMLSAALILFVAAAGLSWICVRVTREIARQRGWVAAVRGDRWHAAATPLFGGVGIVVAFLVALAVTRGAVDDFREATSANSAAVIGLIVGALGAAITGLCDDIFHFRPGVKLAAQSACACAFLWIAGGVQITGSAPVDSVVALLWIVVVMNAVNMLDNMDGIAGMAVMVGLVGVAATNALGAQASTLAVISVIALLGAGCTLGFLGHNLPRARIFMGDAGSLFLGFMLAVLVLMSPRSAMPAAALGCVFVPLLDMTVVSIARIRRGESPMQGGRDHTTHRIARMGISGGRLVVMVGVLAATTACIACAALLWPIAAVTTIGGGFVICCAVLLRMCIRTDGPAHMRAAAFTPFVKVVIDVMTIAAVLNAGYLIRWDFVIPPELANSVAWSLPVALACCVGANALRGAYARSWCVDLVGARRVLMSSFIGAVLAVVVIAALWSPDRLFSRAAMGIFLVGYPVAAVLVRIAVGWIVR